MAVVAATETEDGEVVDVVEADELLEFELGHAPMRPLVLDSMRHCMSPIISQQPLPISGQFSLLASIQPREYAHPGTPGPGDSPDAATACLAKLRVSLASRLRLSLKECAVQLAVGIASP